MLQPKPFRRERQPPPRLRRPPPPSFSRSVVAFLATHILSRRHHSKDMNDTVRIVNDEQRHVHHESSLPLLSRVHEFNATIANTPLHAQTSDMLSLFPPLRYFQIYHAALKKLDDFTFQINKLRRRPPGSYEIDLFDLLLARRHFRRRVEKQLQQQRDRRETIARSWRERQELGYYTTDAVGFGKYKGKRTTLAKYR